MYIFKLVKEISERTEAARGPGAPAQLRSQPWALPILFPLLPTFSLSVFSSSPRNHITSAFVVS